MAYKALKVFIELIERPDGNVSAGLRVDPKPEADYQITAQDLDNNPALVCAHRILKALQEGCANVAQPSNVSFEELARGSGDTLQ